MDIHIDPTKYESVAQAAERLGYTKANITKLIREGKLKAIKRGRRYFISPADVDAYAFGDADLSSFFA